jgi:putative restriction endonuclease
MDAQYLKINDNSYLILDQLENVTVVDSFVKKNKVYGGHGEARLYLGPKQDTPFDNFFGDFPVNCFFVKKDLLDYLNEAKYEYENQEQSYKQDISSSWHEYLTELNGKQDILTFNVECANGIEDAARYYIRSTDTDDVFYDYFRRIALPVITYLSIYKLKNMNTGQVSFLFKPFLDYNFNPINHPAKIKQVEDKIEKDTTLSTLEKAQIVNARVGQGKYRQDLLQQTAECLITKVTDDRILIASHIKPWVLSDDSEKIDPYNGLILTPTYDKLFDQGFITFKDDGELVVSPYLSPMNTRRLNLTSGKKYTLPSGQKRLEYLEYHRKEIFKK